MRRPFFRVRQKTACTVPHLRVPWGKTACSVPKAPEFCWKRGDLRVAYLRNCVQHGQLREPCAGGLRQAQRPAHLFYASQPATHAAVSRRPNSDRVTHAPKLCARTHGHLHPLPCLSRAQPMSPPCVNRSAAQPPMRLGPAPEPKGHHILFLVSPARDPSRRLASAEARPTNRPEPTRIAPSP